MTRVLAGQIFRNALSPVIHFADTAGKQGTLTLDGYDITAEYASGVGRLLAEVRA